MADVERAVVPDQLMGKPDGPWKYHAEFGLKVPTYIKPRKDLLSDGGCAKKIPRLNYHVPQTMRGDFKLADLPQDYVRRWCRTARTDYEGYVLCTSRRNDGGICNKKAVNRSPFCNTHGGALHPADKKLSAQNTAISKIDPKRIQELDRVQQFMSGFLSIEDLEDDEVIGSYVRNSEGRRIATTKMGVRFQQAMVKELVRRMNRFMQMKLPNMINVLTDIAESDFAEPADRIRAANLIIERVLGKTPEVLVHGTTEKPYETLLEKMDKIEGGSREEYRKLVASKRGESEPLEVEAIDYNEDSEEDENEPEQDVNQSVQVVDPSETSDPQTQAKERRERIKKAKVR